jgi:hypothetical protein
VNASDIIVLGSEGGVYRPEDPKADPWTLVAVDDPEETLPWQVLFALPADGQYLAFATHVEFVTWGEQVAKLITDVQQDVAEGEAETAATQVPGSDQATSTEADAS